MVGIVLYFLWQKFQGASSSRSSGPQLSMADCFLPHIKYNCIQLFVSSGPEEVFARQEAMEARRRIMQEQYDLKAQEFAVKQKEVKNLQPFKVTVNL